MNDDGFGCWLICTAALMGAVVAVCGLVFLLFDLVGA